MPGYGFYRTKPHSFRSGIWAVQTALHIERNNAKRKAAEARRAERFSRLKAIHACMVQDFCVPLNGVKGPPEYLNKLNGLLNDAWAYYNSSNLSQGELSKFATCIKKFTLYAENICLKLGVGHIKDPVQYDAPNKLITIGDSKYYLGS